MFKILKSGWNYGQTDNQNTQTDGDLCDLGNYELSKELEK